jgi:peptide/nickel transport system ATP-binding protein
MSLLEVSGLRLEVGERLLLDDVSLRVDAGETVGLVGESGSGKSLTIRAALGLFPDRAEVSGVALLDGVDMVAATPGTRRQQRRDAAAMVFQDPRSGINPVRRVGDFVTEALTRAHGWGARRARDRALELLATVGLPDPERHLTQYPHELSGGMLQRVMIAAALAASPRLLLCDEPTTALDVTTQAEVIRLLQSQRSQRRMGMLFVTHDLNLAASICDRVVVMRGGVIVESGTVDEVFGAPTQEYTRALIAATPSVRSVLASRDSAPEYGSPAALAVTGLTKTYRSGGREIPALRDVSFEVPNGCSLGIVGESGSGKSTIARILVGLEAADAGTVTVAGIAEAAGRRRGRAERIARARRVQIVFQDPYQSLDPRIPVGRAVADVLELHEGLTGRAAETRVLGLLASVGLTADHATAVPRRLSGGQRQRAAIAKALAVEPALLVLDEATSALDVSVQAQVLAVIDRLRRERGQSMVFVSHDLAVVRQVCDEVIVLRAGEVVERGAPDDLLTAPSHPYTRLLVDSIPASR